MQRPRGRLEFGECEKIPGLYDQGRYVTGRETWAMRGDGNELDHTGLMGLHEEGGFYSGIKCNWKSFGGF